jgi:hypothetical protein
MEGLYVDCPLGVSGRDLVFWHQQKDPEAPEHLIHHPECYYLRDTTEPVNKNETAGSRV